MICQLHNLWMMYYIVMLETVYYYFLFFFFCLGLLKRKTPSPMDDAAKVAGINTSKQQLSFVTL